MESKVAEKKEYDKWIEEIPNIKFPNDWEVRIIPPTLGAIVRFLVFKNNTRISVCLDCYDRLGVYGEPYWGIYPAKYNDMGIDRFAMNDIEGLLEGIEKSLE